MEASSTKTARKAEASAPQAEPRAKESSGPTWKRQHGRVQAAVWSHDQNGKTRHTVAITRSYRDAKAGQWRNVHYFDRQDLKDVHAICDEAEQYLLELEGMTQVVGED